MSSKRRRTYNPATTRFRWLEQVFAAKQRPPLAGGLTHAQMSNRPY